MKNLKLYAAENKTHHLSDTNRNKTGKQSPNKSQHTNTNRNKEHNKSDKSAHEVHKKSSS